MRQRHCVTCNSLEDHRPLSKTAYLSSLQWLDSIVFYEYFRIWGFSGIPISWEHDSEGILWIGMLKLNQRVAFVLERYHVKLQRIQPSWLWTHVDLTLPLTQLQRAISCYHSRLKRNPFVLWSFNPMNIPGTLKMLKEYFPCWKEHIWGGSC